MGQCFKVFVDQQRNWEDGKSKCISEGLQLAQPLDVIAIPLRKYILDTYGSKYIWLGAKGDGYQFLWERDNDIISNSNSLWYPGHPFAQGVTTSHCLLLLAHSSFATSVPSKPDYSTTCTAPNRYALCEM